MAIAICAVLTAHGQAAARFMGSVTAISGSTLTVKTDAGEQRQVEVPAEAALKRIEPGQKDLSTAPTMAFSDLAIGDRVLIKLDPEATGATPKAALVVAIKQADVAKKQQADRDDWQKRGVAGLVKNVDTSSGSILVTTGAGPTAKTVTVKTSKATTLKRYAPGSVRFSDAQPAPVDAIHAGDQLRARGGKNSDGSEIEAEDVVSGTFRSVAGTISSIDTASSTIVVKDLSTKKQVSIHLTPDAQMRRLSDRMAQMLAARLKGNASAEGAAGARQQRSGAAGGGAQPAGNPPAGNTTGAPGGAPGQAASGGQGGGDPQRMLAMAPPMKFEELQKGEAVMIVATDGATEVNAITLLAGVAPLLEAPAASNLLSNWSMGGGGGGEAAGGGGGR